MRRSAFALALLMSARSLVWSQEATIHGSPSPNVQAYVTAAQGQVSVQQDQRPWALSTGQRVPIQRLIETGPDGFAHFEVNGGSNFEVYANTRVVFRQNASTAGDLLDVLAGRVRIHLNPGPGQLQQRIFCPIASITAEDPATIAVAVDEDDNVRVDVLEGEVRVQHSLLPRSEPTIVRAVDAILIEKNQQISRRVDRGTLYRYTIKPLHDLFTAITPGHKGSPFQCLGETRPFAWALPGPSAR
jgi:hypothetical protein